MYAFSVRRPSVSHASGSRPSSGRGIAPLVGLGWRDDLAQQCRDLGRPGRWPGRVSDIDHGICTVLSAVGARRVSLGGDVLAAAAADRSRLPCLGDWVVAREWPDGRSTVDAVLRRRTTIVDPGVGKVLAANAETVAVVEAMTTLAEAPEADRLVRLRRLLAVARASGGAPAIVLTKADVVADPHSIAESVAEHFPDVPLYQVAVASAAGRSRRNHWRHRYPEGVAALNRLVRVGTTLCLLGAQDLGVADAGVADVAAGLLADRPERRPRLAIAPAGGAIIVAPPLTGVR